VATTNPILNLVAPLARGALARNHERVMANGYAALRPHVEGSAEAMNFEEDFARRHPDAVERRGGSIYIAFDVAGAFIEEAEHQGIGILGMEGLRIGQFTYPALGRIADFSRAGNDSRSDFVVWSCRQARILLGGPWRSPPVGEADQIHPDASGRYMIDFVLTDRSDR
jgi:hypothetical protein